MMITQVVTWGIAAVTMVYLPRYVGDVVLGRLTLATAYAGFAYLFVSLGTGTVVIRDVAQDHARSGKYLAAILWQRLFLGIVVTLIVVALARFLPYPSQTKMFIWLATGLGIFSALSDGTSQVLQGQENIPRTNVAAVVAKIVGGVLLIAAILMNLPFWTLLVSGGIASISSFVVNMLALYKTMPRPSMDQIVLGNRLIKAGMPFFTNAIFMTIYSQCNPIILERISGDAPLGWYGLVTRLFGTCLFIPTVIAGAMLPALTRLRTEDPTKFPDVARRMIGFNILCAAPIACIIIAMPKQIIELLHYPAGFLNAVPVFVLFGFGLVLWYLSISVGTVLTALELQNEFARASSRAAFLVVPISIVCIWATQKFMHNGAVGAAASNIFIELYMLSCFVRALPSGLLPARHLYNVLARISVAALPMGLCIYLLHGISEIVALFIGVAVYAVLCYWMGCISTKDVALLRSVATRKVQPIPA